METSTYAVDVNGESAIELAEVVTAELASHPHADLVGMSAYMAPHAHDMGPHGHQAHGHYAILVFRAPAPAPAVEEED